MTLNQGDIRTALAAVEFWRSAHRLSQLPVPPALDRTAANLQAMAALKRQEGVVPQPQWLTTAEVAERMQCSTNTALRTARRLGHRVGRQWLTPADALPED
jgi:hypothetical protein